MIFWMKRKSRNTKSGICPLSKEAAEVAREYAERTGCTARGYHRMWKVARTIADLADSETVLPEHMAEAVGFRTEQEGDYL